VVSAATIRLDDDQHLSRPDSEKGRLQRECLQVMQEHERDGALPTSIRFVFYELVQRGALAKKKTGVRTSSQDLSDAFTHLREAGIIPWDWLVDETRTLTEWNCATTVAEYLRQRLAEARLNPWGGPPPLILTESLSLKGVLDGTAYEYTCPIAATRGQVGGFLRTDIGPRLQDGRPVLYLGDLDHQGGQIEVNTRRVLEGILGWGPGWQRVAITASQVDDRDLTPILKPDKRYKPVRTHEAWETEALGQQTVVALVRQALDELLPEPLTDVRVREQQQRESEERRFDGGGDE
jgi:hypothetical protein